MSLADSIPFAKRRNHADAIAAIKDLNDPPGTRRPRIVQVPPIPGFLRRQDTGPVDLDEFDHELGPYIDSRNTRMTDEDPRQMVGNGSDLPDRLVAEMKEIIKRLPYGSMKRVGAEIGKLAGIEGPKQADALHAWAADEEPAP